MKRANLVRDRFLAELESWLSPGVLYHSFTGEGDAYRLAHIERLDPSMREPLLNKAMREWPQRLERIAAERMKLNQESKAVVRAFVQATDSPHPQTEPATARP